MDETQTTEQGNTETPSADGQTLIARAKSEREALIRENERLEKNIAALREVETSRLLGSTAGGHIEGINISEEEARKNKSAEFWKGTDIEDAIKKYG